MVFMKRVSVPAFVNPHLFWIFEAENTEQRNQFQKGLNENLKNPTKIKAQQGELVVILDNKTWKRAEVINAFEENYDCWLIDYGSLLKTMSVYKLPIEFTVTPAMIHMACLNNIIEAPTVLEIETGSYIRQEVINFSQGLSTLINTLIFQAETIVFHTQRVIDHVLCGKMQLTKNGVSYNITDKLLEEKRIAVNEELFREAFKVNNRGVMHLRNYKIYEAQKSENLLVADEDIGIGRGYNRSIRSKRPGVRSPQPHKNFVQTWVEESSAQLISDRKLGNATANSFGASTSNEPSLRNGTQKFQNQLTTNKFNSTLNSEYIDPSKLYEGAEDITLNATEPSKRKSLKSNSSSSFENSAMKERKNIIITEKDESRSRPKSRLNRSLDSVSDDYFETVEDDVSARLKQDHSTKKSQSKLKQSHESIGDDFFESVDDDKTFSEIKNESFERDESKLRNQKSTNQKSKMASTVDDFDPFSNSDEDSSAHRQSKGTRKSSLIKQHVNNPVSDFDEDSLRKSENDESHETRNKSSMSSKLPGFNVYPAGTTLPRLSYKSKVTSRSQSTSRSSTSRKYIKQRQVTSKSPKEEVLLRKSSGSSVSASSDCALKNEEAPQPVEETSNTLSSDSDSECAPEPCKKNLFHFGCKCENCRMWNENDIAGENNKYKDSRNVSKREMVRPSLLFKTDDSEDAVDIKTKKIKGTKIERDMAPTLLVHGFCVPAPVSKVNEVPFNTHVLRALTKLKFSSAKSIQSYAWPALMRHMNVCMVHGAGIGKTMAYLPAICSYILELSERYVDLPKANGPVAIVLCKGVRKVEETYSLFCNFRAHVGKRININWAASPLDNSSLKSIQASDVLIATPLVLITLLTRRVITLKRLCHFVVEETDQVLSKFPQEFDDLMEVVQSMLKHRSCIYSVQIILGSEHWTISLEKFVKKLYSVPLICIGAYLESALYGRADIQMHFVQSKVKLSMLCDILKEMSHIRKTVIVCNEEDEIDAVEEYLRIKGVSVTSAKSTMLSEEVLEVELMWENTVCGKHVALICTDALLHGQLSITNANVLVHYSLPQDSWTQFSRRFKCLVDCYESPFNSKRHFDKCQVHIFVDEACNKQFPRLYNFLQTMGAKISEKFSELCKKFKESKELEKIELQTKLCPTLKLFGKCEKVNCQKRHLLSGKDVSTTLPQSGLIKFKLITVNDVSVYTVHLTEHTGIDGKINKYPDSSDFGVQLTQSVKQNQMYVKDPKLGGLFAWFDAENNAYHRCEIIRVLSENKITKLADDVHIKLIDTGCVKKTTTALLFELPEFYKTLPAQGIEVYLANLLPPDRDTEWSFNMRHKVEKILDKAEYQKTEAYFTGRVVLQLANTLWLEDVVLLEDLSFSNESVRKLLLKKSLLDTQLVAHKPEQLSHLYDLCKTAGIVLCDYDYKTTTGQVTTHNVQQVKPQWAHLDEENLNAVYFCSGISPHLFYVRLEKFYGLFHKLQKELQNLVNQPHYPVVKEITLGNCYLVKDPGSEEFCRAIVTEIQDETVECFFVDFGDGACVFKNEIKHLPDGSITQLPFQAVECKLFGISPPMDVWPDEATDILYQYCFEPKNVEGCDTKSDVFRTLYVSTLSAMKNGSNGCRNYSVLLVDYYSRKPVLINKILIDCGFALPEEDISLENITLPDCQDYNDEQDDDILNIKDEKDFAFNEVNGGEEKSPSPSESENVWDIEIDDAEEFLKDFMGKRKSEKPLRISDKTFVEAYPIKALPPAKHHTPDLTWYQTDRHIKIDIKLPNVTKYALHILRKQIFTFSTTSGDKEYKLNFQLYEDVEKTFQHSSAGLVIRVTLEKCNSVEWPRLTKSEQKFRYIKYDVSKCNFPEEKKRLFLEIDGDEKDEEVTDNYFVIGSDEDYSESDIESNLSDD